MFVREYTQSQWSLMVKWLILFALASAIALLFAATTASGEDQEPQLLPPQVYRWAAPMTVESADPVADTGGDLVDQLWTVIDLHRADFHEQAIDTWHRTQMPCDTEVWKLLGLARAYIATGQIEQAASMLEQADRGWPEHPVASHFTGLLRLQQAYLAREWEDAKGPESTILVAISKPPEISPNSKGMYLLAAMGEFEEAIKNRDSLTMTEELVPAGWPSTATVRPNVGDLLDALGARRFVGDSHLKLANWYLDHAAATQAEEHIDAAAREGVKVALEYTRLGKAYENGDMPVDASRAYLKAMMQQGDKLGPAWKAWESLRNAFRDIL